MYSKILEVSKQTGIPVKKLLDVFYILRTGESVENNKLLRKVGVSKNAVNQVKKASSSLLKATSKNTQLTSEGVSKVKNLYRGKYMNEEALWSILETNQFLKVLKLIESYKEKRPVSKREYDQFTATPETTARRASLLDFFGDVRGKRILFLGDGDFTSIATASLGEAKSIMVVDIDEQILKAISEVSDNQNFEIETIKYDARKALPGELKRRFDVVFTDPPYTPEGMRLFISRAVEALNLKNQAARIYSCYGNSDRAKERFLPIYNVFVDSGLMIRWVFDKFNRYQGAGTIGSASSLFISEVTPNTKLLVQGDYDKSIYTNN